MTRFTLPALLAGRSRRPRPLRRDWLRIADRLAAGMPPHAAALPEGGDESMVMGLLEREDFRGLVAAARALQEEPPEASRKRLVILARQALERALAWDDDPRAALFVLDEEAKGRDPAATVAEAVAKGPRPRPPAEPRPRARPPCPYDSFTSMCGRSRRALAEAVRGEDAVRRAATARLGTAEAAKRALAMRRAAAASTTARPDHRPRPADAKSSTADPVTRHTARGPRRTRGP
jgi:hypothetical protein